MLKNFKFLFLFLFSGFISCQFINTNVTDFNFMLPEKEFTVDSEEFDLGDLANEDTLPGISCPENSCPDNEAFFCDSISGQCAASFEYNLQSKLVNLRDEVQELSVVGSQDHITVNFSYIQMEVIINTLNMDLPPMKIYIAPHTVTSFYDSQGSIDSQISLIGELPIILSQQTGTYDINMTKTGEEILSKYVQEPDVPFYFFVAGEVTFKAGDPIPQGAIKLKVHSMATASVD